MQCDAGVFADSSLKRAIDRNLLNFPEPEYLDGTQTICNYHIIGDDAFPLGLNVMKPYPIEIWKRVSGYLTTDLVEHEEWSKMHLAHFQQI